MTEGGMFKRGTGSTVLLVSLLSVLFATVGQMVIANRSVDFGGSVLQTALHRARPLNSSEVMTAVGHSFSELSGEGLMDAIANSSASMLMDFHSAISDSQTFASSMTNSSFEALAAAAGPLVKSGREEVVAPRAVALRDAQGGIHAQGGKGGGGKCDVMIKPEHRVDHTTVKNVAQCMGKYTANDTKELEDLWGQCREHADLVIAPVVKAVKKGDKVMIVDCVGKFTEMCENLLSSARRAKLPGVYVITTGSAAACKRFPGLQEGEICIEQEEFIKFASHHVRKRNPQQTTYATTSHGNLLELMLTRWSIYWRLNAAGFPILIMDADIAVLKDVWAYADPSRFIFETARGYGRCNRKTFPVTVQQKLAVYDAANKTRKVDSSSGKAFFRECFALCPPYISQPEAEFLWDRGVWMFLACPRDNQYDMNMDLVRLAEAFTIVGYKEGRIDGMEEHEWVADLNPTKVEVTTKQGCPRSTRGFRLLPQSLFTTHCNHPKDLKNNSVSYSLHANCVMRKGNSVQQKKDWLSGSGGWFLGKA